jgi:parallel beta-helix repeat protein
LLIFIHGIGELGNGTTQLPRVLKNAVPRLIETGQFPTSFKVKGKSFSFIVASPQFRNVPSPADVLSLINYLKGKFRIDEKRIYVTGLSMGGGATEDFASANDSYAQIPAAVVPVAGNMNPKWMTNAPKTLAKNRVPVWFLHNEGDPTVPSQFSKDWVSMMDKHDPKPKPKLTIFDKRGHDAWTTAYDPSYRENGKNIYEWMLQYEKGKDNDEELPPSSGNKKVIAKTNVGNGMWYLDAMKEFKLNPGDTLCIPAGDYEFIQLGNLVGTAAKPIVITNCGGQVRTGIRTLKSDVSFGIMGGKYLHISGSGTPGVEYGFDVNGRNTLGVKMEGVYLGSGSSDIDIHNFSIHDVGSFVVAKTTQECDKPQFWEGRYVMKNVKIHHIKGRNAAYEGFYIGNTHYEMDYLLCKNIKSHHIQDLEVYDNDLQYMGQDAIQVSMADLGENKIHHNIVRDYGTTRVEAQGYGLLMGGGSRVKLYNNVVDNGYMPGIALFGSGVSHVYNNIVSNVAHGEGINVADKLVLEPVTAYIYNNTVYNTGTTGITIYAYLTKTGHKVYNNLVIEKAAGGSYPSEGIYIRGAQNIKFDYGNNQFSTIANAAKVVTNVAAGDFRLTSNSTSIDAGKSVSDLGLTTDLGDNKRPTNSGYDVGAFEYQGPKTPPKGNVSPVANAGRDITITLPTNTVTLDGSTSTDTDGKLGKYLWRKLTGPAAGTITNAATATTSVTGLTAGTYIFTLTVTDDKAATDVDSITVKVNAAPANKPPVSNPGSGVTITLPTNTATLDGKASADPDGSISQYLWKKVSGPKAGAITQATAATTTVTGLTAGSYVFSLTVTDNRKATSTSTVTVTVNRAPNKAPVADAGVDKTVVLPASTVMLDGGASKDPDGKITKYAWRKVSGPAAGTFTQTNTAKTYVTGLAAGTYVFSLTVTDDDNATSTASATVVVRPAPIPNKAPVADAGVDKTVVLPASTVMLDGGASKDPDGSITKYAWRKVSGPAAGAFTQTNTAKTYVTGLVAGTYVFSLTVTDDDNATSTATATVVVKPSAAPPVNKAPVASAGPDLTITLPNNTATLDGSASADRDGSIVKYTWSTLSGPGAGTFTQSTVPVTKATALIAGTYVLTLTVTDNDNATDTDTVRVVVKPATSGTNVPPLANAGSDVTITMPVNSVVLNAAASSDADGTVTNYQWLKISGKDVRFSNATGIINVVSGLTEGTYIFELLISDNRGASARDRLTVTVLGAKGNNGKAPVSRTQGDLTIQLPTASINADGSRSYATDGNITAYSWKQVYGPLQATIETPSARNTRISGMNFPGSYVFELAVTDENKLSSRSTFEVTVMDIGEDASVPEITTYPNPVVNTLYFQQRMKNAGPGVITVFNMSGNAMKSFALPASDNVRQSLDVSSLPIGTYILQVTYKNSAKKWSTKFIKAN